MIAKPRRSQSKAIFNVSPLKMDPTRTATLRRAWTQDFNRKFAELSRRIVTLVDTQDSFGLVHNAAWGFQSSAEQITAFKAWMQQQVNILLLADGEKSWWRKYITDGFRKGQGRVFDDFKMGDRTQAQKDFLKFAFNNPVSQERLDVLAARVFTELEGVTDAMAQQITRVLTDGLTQGKNPKQIAKDMVDRVDKVGKNRARMIAQTEIIRAHSEGQLTELEKMGVQHVGVQVEFSAAHKGACPICQALNNKKYTLVQARGVIPVHVCCRCCWRPSVDTDVLVGPVPATPSEEHVVEQQIPEASPEPKKSVWQKLKTFLTGNQERGLPVANIKLWTILRQLFEPTANFNPAHDKLGRFARGSGHTDVSFLGSLKHVKALGGSTGATLVEDEHGHQYVMKKGSSAGHLRAEYAAEQAYRALGVSVPHSKFYETPNGPVKLSQFKKGAELGTLSKNEQNLLKAQLQKNFAAHALLANWDVVGMKKDNILVSVKKGVYQEHHIDAGGSLDYRAKGGMKGEQWNGQANEFESMRNGKNAQTAEIFGSMTPAQIQHSVDHVVANKESLLAALPEKYHEIIKQRIVSLQNKAKALTAGVAASPDPIVKKTSSNTPEASSHLNTGDALANYVKQNPGDGKFTQLHLDKIKYLNTHGIVGGVFFTGTNSTPHIDKAQTEQLKKLLPAGTVIKKVDINAKQMAEGWLPVGHKVLHKKSKTEPTKPAPDKAVLEKSPTSIEAIAEQAVKIAAGSALSVGHYTMAYYKATGKIPDKAEKSKHWEHLLAKIASPEPQHDIFGNPKTETDKPKHNPGADQSHTTFEAVKLKGESTSHLPAVKSWKAGLESSEQAAISLWKSSAKKTRAAFANDPPPPPKDKYAAAFYSAISKAPQVEGTVYRGISGSYAKTIADECKLAGVGGTWHDTAPMCQSLNTGTAHKFANGETMLVIKTKTARFIKDESGYGNEEECTAMPNTLHRIVAIHSNHVVGGKKVANVVELEEVHGPADVHKYDVTGKSGGVAKPKPSETASIVQPLPTQTATVAAPVSSNKPTKIAKSVALGVKGGKIAEHSSSAIGGLANKEVGKTNALGLHVHYANAPGLFSVAEPGGGMKHIVVLKDKTTGSLEKHYVDKQTATQIAAHIKNFKQISQVVSLQNGKVSVL